MEKFKKCSYGKKVIFERMQIFIYKYFFLYIKDDN